TRASSRTVCWSRFARRTSSSDRPHQEHTNNLEAPGQVDVNVSVCHCNRAGYRCLTAVTDANEPLGDAEALRKCQNRPTQPHIRRSALLPKDLDAAPGNIAGESCPHRFHHGLLSCEPSGVIAVMHRRLVSLLALIG